MKIVNSVIKTGINEKRSESAFNQLSIDILRNSKNQKNSSSINENQKRVEKNKIETVQIKSTSFHSESTIHNKKNDNIQHEYIQSNSDSQNKTVENLTQLSSSNGRNENFHNGNELFSIEIERKEQYSKKQDLYYTANGKVQTSSGLEIEFQLGYQMKDTYERTKYSSDNIMIEEQSVQMEDPLVLNFDGRGARLSENKIEFDLDSDGDKERISFLEKGSGFLVYDRNKDGIVNDGSELFGVKSGDGFADLRRYDEDGNGWIDENDLVYKDLKVWTKDSNGKDILSSIQQSNVGAIFLGKEDSSYEINGGKVRGMGLYLTEEGRSMILQQVDLEKGNNVQLIDRKGEESISEDMEDQIEKLKNMAEAAFQIEQYVKSSLEEIKIKRKEWQKTKEDFIKVLMEKLSKDFRKLQIHQLDIRLWIQA